ncbi:response regulator [Myxococcus sp. CA051A]|uniref:Response regulator n=1 Tax=Myxococcus llanfairpwllgwyngyllgogerychwyrndrobwllllantysiliogogogochensis TaxID=2590453 RepID=A0A540WU62_9BACT|nr:response regulator [Myxococcus llanfairpwllgwyngyllgogerychwyrndrobwllllantysiliogogogochensis]NTX01242.1 response regulator [Myxococcus sp. CA040A]NTX12052.1 response regulator [Myxococcus sp. CA056]NTX33067.1 response regulator [Myxococcus sp. CA033]NTX56253.1 response regulator [Myxococcus sp. CA039A]NTX59869.1 response regulator [Myxococcus sp. CA051A]
MAGPILVVDDDLFFRQLASDMLSRHGHRVVSVENGTLALEEAARTPFDLVITDVVMPGVDGFALTARLRERDPDQEVILVSHRTDVKGSEMALRSGAADCLAKPVEEADLVLAVDRALERAALRRERTQLRDENIEFARFHNLHQRCLELISQSDLEWLQERIISELSAVCDAQSAALWVLDDRGDLVLRAYRGLLDKQFLAEKMSPEGPLAGRLRDAQPWFARDERSAVLYVPLMVSGEIVGLAQLSDPLAGDFRAEHSRDARVLADFAAVGVKNGRRMMALQRLGLRDRETAAYNLSYFTDYASKEIYKARRYGRTFSLLTFSIDNLPLVRVRQGAADAKKAVRGIIRALSKIIRDSDVIAKASDQEFYLLLPETDFFGAMMFVRRAVAAVREEPEVQDVESRLPLALVGGASTFPKDGEDFDELVHRCRRRMDERRASLQRRLMLDGLPFWDEVDLLLGTPNSPRLPVDERAEPSRRGKVADVLFDELQAEIARELTRDPGTRGLLYVGGPEIRADLPIAAGLESAPPDLSSRIYLLGRRVDLESHPALTPVFLEGDERVSRHEFILWLSESAAYALIQRRGRGATWGFHTSDTAVVDGLISKLQAEYDLQPY